MYTYVKTYYKTYVHIRTYPKIDQRHVDEEAMEYELETIRAGILKNTVSLGGDALLRQLHKKTVKTHAKRLKRYVWEFVGEGEVGFCVYVFFCVYACMCTYLCIYAFIYVYKRRHTHTHAHTHTHTHTHTHKTHMPCSSLTHTLSLSVSLFLSLSHKYTQTHTNTQKRTQKHTHTHTHTRTQGDTGSGVRGARVAEESSGGCAN